MHKEVQTD